MSDMISAIKYCMPTFEFLLLLWFWCSFLWHWLLHLCLLSVYLKDCMWSNLPGLPLHIICILQTIKYWRWERPGNETNFHNKLCMPGLQMQTACVNSACSSCHTENDAVSLVHWITWSSLWLINFNLRKTGHLQSTVHNFVWKLFVFIGTSLLF